MITRNAKNSNVAKQKAKERNYRVIKCLFEELQSVKKHEMHVQVRILPTFGKLSCASVFRVASFTFIPARCPLMSLRQSTTATNSTFPESSTLAPHSPPAPKKDDPLKFTIKMYLIELY
jgi:hypothetical protein